MQNAQQNAQPENIIPMPQAEGKTEQPENNVPLDTGKRDSNGLKKLGYGMIPFSPVPFSGKDMPLAVIRTSVYGVLTVLTWEKYRKISYLFAGALGVSLLTSFSAKAYNES